MSPYGIVPFARGQHRIDILYRKVSSIHQRALPVKYLNPLGWPNWTKVHRNRLRPAAYNACHRAKFNRVQSDDVPEVLQKQ